MKPVIHESPNLGTVPWSDAELTSAVQAYIGMLYAELDGADYSKAEVNLQLREGPLAGRTKASIEFRMQNISAALYEMKMPRIKGYVPAKNIGTAVKEKLIAILNENGIGSLSAFIPTPDPRLLADRVTELRKLAFEKVPEGSKAPSVVTVTSSTYVRDPAVKAWVLLNSNGLCEGCEEVAPFVGSDGLPYLEAHHVMPLSRHGSDTIMNVVALCPNCHRRCHFSNDRDEFKLSLYERIKRLVVEVPG